MKIIIENETAIVKFLLEDSHQVDITDESIVISVTTVVDEKEVVQKTTVFQLNATNSTLVENVAAPEEFRGNKYKYIDGAYSIIENWEPPVVAE